MIHLYCGDGKGKTTAAVGLAVRAAGSGKKVLFTQFFKDGSSSELAVLRKVDGIQCFFAEKSFGRYKTLSQEQKRECAKVYQEFFAAVRQRARDFDLVVLDEVVSANNYGLVPTKELLALIEEMGSRELVMTGRNPGEELIEAADYLSEIQKRKHPFDRGIHARHGIEY